MANSINRYTGVDPNGETSIMSKVVVTSAGFLALAELPKQDSYTLRLWVKASGSRTAMAYIGGTSFTMSITTAWNVFTFTATAVEGDCTLYLPTGTYYIWHPMLEASTKPSDWRPAPEDTDANIKSSTDGVLEAAKDYTNRILLDFVTTEQMESAIRQTQEEISLSVSKQTTRSMTYAQTQATNALNTANAATDNKLLSYVTTTKHTADLRILSESITSAVTATETLATYVDGDFYNQITNEYTSTITQTATGIESRVAQTYATITTVNGVTNRITTAESRITQNSNAITSTVTRLDTTESRVSTCESRITQTANSLTSTVRRVGSCETQISQNTDSIETLTTDMTGAKSQISQNVLRIQYLVRNAERMESEITQTATDISLCVRKANLVSEINQSAGEIRMTSNRFVVDSTNFKLSANGTITATNANLSGTLTTTSGKYTTKLSSGVLEGYYDGALWFASRVFFYDQAHTQPVHYSFCGTPSSGGISLGIMNGTSSSDSAYRYITVCNGDEVTRNGCRLLFNGDAKFINCRFKSSIDFDNDIGIAWGGNIGLRFVNGSGLWLGITGDHACDLKLAGSGLYFNCMAQNSLNFVDNQGIAWGGNIGLRYMSGNNPGIYLGIQNSYLYFVGTTRNNLNFADNCGVAWGNNVGLAYRTGSSSGIYLGIHGTYACPIHIDGTNTYVNGTSRLEINSKVIFLSATSIDITGNMTRNINFADNVGLAWGGNIGIRYYNGQYPSGMWLGINGGATVLTGSQINFKSVAYTKDNVVVTSDRRIKKNITDLDERYLSLLDKISGKTYQYIDHNPDSTKCGFIAQDVMQAMHEVGLDPKDFYVVYDQNEDGSRYALDYMQFIPILWNIVKKQWQIVESQKNELAELRRKIS